MIEVGGCQIDKKKSGLIHTYAKEHKLTDTLLKEIMTGEKMSEPKNMKPKPIQVKQIIISRYFTEVQSRKEIEDTIEKALALYFENKELVTGR